MIPPIPFRRPRRTRDVCLAILVSMAAIFFGPVSLVSGHAALVKADPAPLSTLTKPPVKVTIWTSEPLNPSFSSIQVFDSQSRRVDLDNSSVASDDPYRMEVGLQPIKEDTYTVLWAANSQFDGHTLRGTYSFAVNLSGSPVISGETTILKGSPYSGNTIRVWSPATIVQAIAQWIVLLTALLLVGSLLFRIIVPKVLSIQGNADLVSMLVNWSAVRWAGTERFLAILLPSGTIVSTIAIMANASSSWASAFSPSFIRDFVFGSPFGIATLVKTTVSLVVVGAILTHSARNIALGGGLFFLALVAFTGHARAVDQPLLLPIVLDWIHLVAASAWLGGIIFIVKGLLQGGDKNKKLPIAWPQFIRILDGFSPIALISVGLLFATGFYNSITRLSSPGDLLSSGFGLVLTVKIIAVAVMIILGYLNVFVTRPRLKLLPEKQPGNLNPQSLILRRLLAWEPIIGVVAVMTTAVLTVYPPPGLGLGTKTSQPIIATPQTQASARTGTPVFSLARRAEDLLVILSAGPGDMGRNRISVSLANAADGRPLQNAALVRLRATFLGQESGSQFIVTEPQPDKTFAGDVDFSFKGSWKVEVIVRQQDKADVTASFPLVIPATDASALLARADKAMNGLKNMAIHEEVQSTVGAVQVTDFEFQAPERVHIRDQRGGEVYVIGINQFFKEPGGKWQRGTGPGRLAFAWSNLNFNLFSWERPVIVGSERIEGQPHSIVTVFDSQNRLHYLLWIGTDDNLVRRWQHIGAGHFIDDRFSGFNSTAIPVAESELPR